MGLIMHNGIPYGGGGGGTSDNSWTGTKAEFEAIKDTLKDDTVIYIIDDYTPGGSGESIIDITQEQYDALSQEEKEKGVYNIIDAAVGKTIAELETEINEKIGEVPEGENVETQISEINQILSKKQNQLELINSDTLNITSSGINVVHRHDLTFSSDFDVIGIVGFTGSGNAEQIVPTSWYINYVFFCNIQQSVNCTVRAVALAVRKK